MSQKHTQHLSFVFNCLFTKLHDQKKNVKGWSTHKKKISLTLYVLFINMNILTQIWNSLNHIFWCVSRPSFFSKAESCDIIHCCGVINEFKVLIILLCQGSAEKNHIDRLTNFSEITVNAFAL